jgi:nitroreductase/NAD-dependent dihydropyrimidine dehydrogenase PreA subunit
MLNFIVDPKLCTGCGECALDCPARVIEMADDRPRIVPEKEYSCYRCQHCFTVCPTGAISILGLNPKESLDLGKKTLSPDQVELLMKGRRSVRRYEPVDLEPAQIRRLVEVAQHAPTAVNNRSVHFTVVDKREKLAEIRREVMTGLARLVRENALPEGREFFADFVRMWEENQVDVLFRGAPHFVVASAPETAVAPMIDCVIALSYFELFAQSAGVGTVWCGLVKWAINDLLPEMKAKLGIPPDHVVGYVMLFGKPAVHYARTAQRAVSVSYVR